MSHYGLVHVGSMKVERTPNQHVWSSDAGKYVSLLSRR